MKRRIFTYVVAVFTWIMGLGAAASNDFLMLALCIFVICMAIGYKNFRFPVNEIVFWTLLIIGLLCLFTLLYYRGLAE